MVISKPKHFLKLYQMGVQLSYCSRDPKNSDLRNTEVEFFTLQPSHCPLRWVCQCCSMDELGIQVALILLFPQPLGTVPHVLRPRLWKQPTCLLLTSIAEKQSCGHTSLQGGLRGVLQIGNQVFRKKGRTEFDGHLAVSTIGYPVYFLVGSFITSSKLTIKLLLSLSGRVGPK